MFMLSMPPATMTSASPARMAAAPIITAFSPEPQTLLMVVALTPSGSPAFSAAWRAGAWPAPACRTWPMIASSIRSGAMPRSLDGRADGDARPGRWPEWSRARRRTCRSGVRAAERMYTSRMEMMVLAGVRSVRLGGSTPVRRSNRATRPSAIPVERRSPSRRPGGHRGSQPCRASAAWGSAGVCPGRRRRQRSPLRRSHFACCATTTLRATCSRRPWSSIWRDLPMLRDPARFDAWSYRLIVRQCHAELRRCEASAVDGSNSCQAMRRSAMTRSRSRSGMSSNARSRGCRPISARCWCSCTTDGQTIPEIAAALGIPQGTVKSRLHYARAAMRAAVEADARPVTAGRTPRMTRELEVDQVLRSWLSDGAEHAPERHLAGRPRAHRGDAAAPAADPAATRSSSRRGTVNASPRDRR